MKASHQIQFPIIHKYTDGTLISMEKLIGMLIHLNVRIPQSSLNLPYLFLLFGGGSSVCLLFCPLKTTESVTKNANEVYFSFFKAHYFPLHFEFTWDMGNMSQICIFVVLMMIQPPKHKALIGQAFRQLAAFSLVSILRVLCKPFEASSKAWCKMVISCIYKYSAAVQKRYFHHWEMAPKF